MKMTVLLPLRVNSAQRLSCLAEACVLGVLVVNQALIQTIQEDIKVTLQESHINEQYFR